MLIEECGARAELQGGVVRPRQWPEAVGGIEVPTTEEKRAAWCLLDGWLGDGSRTQHPRGRE
jgi:hypothetical protein